MNRRRLLLIIFVIALSGCGKGQKAREELARLNVEYTESSFIENARDGNTDAVKLFLDAGMNTEVKTREAQKEFAKARGNAQKAGNASNASQRITEANKALDNLTTARADIIDP